jgi:hypothetical protein
MAETLKDINVVTNVGGALTHWNGIATGGGEMTRYDKTPIGGPPAADYDTDVRSPLEATIRTRVVGADAAARTAVIAGFARGETFSVKASPSGSGDMSITGLDAVGTDMIVDKDPEVSVNHGENAELTVHLIEVGPTPA